MLKWCIRSLSVIALLIGFATLPPYPSAAPTDNPGRAVKPLNDIMVLLDSSWPDPATVIAQIRANDIGLRTRLQSPASARYLQTARIRPNVLARLPSSDRFRILQQVVVLTYPDKSSADLAERALRIDPSVLLIAAACRRDFYPRLTSAAIDPIENAAPAWVTDALRNVVGDTD